ncbi:thioredoxin [Montanilutibacter psychrotolerans]|uniref:Thioredoxin n=1 Tax=Montanilutibacter psychrotolerans TaxID=1327343 RepID=A0A3M8SYM5_9GAMM|nr:thioredoxin [Lysobacter psychrotolerans]RNF86339.1 thioredoxin [Lysobacter psychrotolerans]
MSDHAHVFDARTDTFEAEVIHKSMQVPVLVDFWAEWCGPCKQLGPVLEKLAGEYHGTFELAKIDVDAEPQLAGAFQVRSIPTLFLVKGGQVVDMVPGALTEGQLREFLKHHGVEPGVAAAPDAEVATEAAPLDPHAEVARLREEIAASPEQDSLKLDLALALLLIGATGEAEALLDALPANLATDDRALRGRARLGFAAVLHDAPTIPALEAAIANDPADLRARYLLGAHHLVGGDAQTGLEQFLEMLRIDRGYDEGLPRKALIDAFRVVEDAELVGRYRRRMSSLLF